MKRTPEEFKNQAEIKGIKRWLIHDCSLCNYKCGFVFREEAVFYDGGCHCVNFHDFYETTWDHVSNHYNIQSNDNTIKEMDKFWGFE